LSIENWILFCITDAFLCALPGPGVLFIISQTITHGLKLAVYTIFGILLANIFYFVLAASGLVTTLSSYSAVYNLLKVLGSLYLIYIGITIFRLPRIQQKIINSMKKGNSALTQGFIIHASNPKVLLLFSTIVPMFIEPNATLIPQLVLMGISVLIIQAGILFTYAWCSKKMIGYNNNTFALFINKVGGLSLITLGVAMIITGQS